MAFMFAFVVTNSTKSDSNMFYYIEYFNLQILSEGASSQAGAFVTEEKSDSNKNLRKVIMVILYVVQE